MRTSKKGSVEMPAFVRQLVKETEKRVTSFFKGGRGGSGGEPAEGEEAAEEEGVIQSPYLDRPVLEKYMEEGCASWGITYALGSMQGWRAHMEDFHNCYPQLGAELSHWGFFAVYDGHAGSMVAQHCSQNLLEHMLGTGESLGYWPSIQKAAGLSHSTTRLSLLIWQVQLLPIYPGPLLKLTGL